MSTRAVIARWTSVSTQEWAGRYHHWDGYPSGLGATLYRLVKNQTLGDLTSTLRVLLDDHPAGWSTINGCDWRKPSGYDESSKERCATCRRRNWEHYAQYYKTPRRRKRLEAILATLVPEKAYRIRRHEEFVLWHPFVHKVTMAPRPHCYCHGDRREEAWELTQSDAAGSGVEWAYVFDVARRTMSVLEAVFDGRHSVGMFGTGNSEAAWSERAEVSLDKPEPNWEALQS
jgi:hypothetical protein